MCLGKLQSLRLLTVGLNCPIYSSEVIIDKIIESQYCKQLKHENYFFFKLELFLWKINL